MALLFMESWDGYGGTAAHATKWADVNGLGTSSPSPRTGSYRVGGTSAACNRAISPTGSLIIGFAFYWGGSTSGTCQLWADAAFSVATQCGFNITTSGQVQMRLGNAGGGTVINTSAVVVVASSWNFIEAKILVANSGTYDLKVNGVSVLSGSADTQNNAASTVAGIGFAAGAGGNAIDDIYVLDTSGSYLNDFIGDCKVECLTPQTGSGTNTGLTLSTGSDHGAVVDEFPATDDTDYAYGSSAGVKDTYNFTNLTTTGTVYAVQTSIRAKKTDAAAKTLAVVCRDNSTDSDGATQAVAATTYGQYQQIWEKRPSDSAAWSVSDVDGAEFGMKVVS